MEDAAKAKKRATWQSFGQQVQEIGDQYGKNPYEYKLF